VSTYAAPMGLSRRRSLLCLFAAALVLLVAAYVAVWSVWMARQPAVPRRRADIPPEELKAPGQQTHLLGDGRPRVLVVTESLPTKQDGGGMRMQEVVGQLSRVFAKRVLLAARSRWNPLEWLRVDDDFYMRGDVDVIMGSSVVNNRNENVDPVLVQRDPNVDRVAVPRWEPTFGNSNTGHARSLFDFGAFLGGRGAYVSRGPVALEVALLAMWAFRIAPSGDPHLTIPEETIPVLRAHSPDTCVLVLSDDIQHRRFAAEAGLSPAAAQRMAERELAVYAAADGVFFTSEEDRAEVEAMLRNRAEARGWPKRQQQQQQEQQQQQQQQQQPKLLVLPYSSSPEASPTASAFAPLSWARGGGGGGGGGGAPLLLFVGSNTRSNRKAVGWLAREVLPLMRKRRGKELMLSVAGGVSVQAALNVSDKVDTSKSLGVEPLGFVKDIGELLSRTSLLLVPGMVASGTTTKVHLGVAHSVPIVTNKNGVRGAWRESDALPPSCQQLPDKFRAPLVVAEDAAAYATAALRLLDDEGLYAGVKRCLADWRELRSASLERTHETVLGEMRSHCGAIARARESDLPGEAYMRRPDRLPPASTPLERESEAEWPAADGSFVRLHTQRFAAWRGDAAVPSSSYRRARDLTLLSTFNSDDAHLLRSWLEDISRQRALSIYSIELVVACVGEQAFELMVGAVNQTLALLGELARVSVFMTGESESMAAQVSTAREGPSHHRYRYLYGLRAVWDAIVARPSSAPIVSNWNVRDRKRGDSLLKRLQVMSEQCDGSPCYGAVSSDVLTFREQSGAQPRVHPCTWVNGWESGWAAGNGQLHSDVNWPTLAGCYAWGGVPVLYVGQRLGKRSFGEGTPRRLGLVDLFKLPSIVGDKAALDPSAAAAAAVLRGVPGNALMWRRSMHTKLGGFKPLAVGPRAFAWKGEFRGRDEGGCADISFWLRALIANFSIWQMNEPLELELERPSASTYPHPGTDAGTGTGTGGGGEVLVPECSIVTARLGNALRRAIKDRLRAREEKEATRAERVRGKRAWWVGVIATCMGLLLLLLRRIRLCVLQSQIRRSQIYSKVIGQGKAKRRVSPPTSEASLTTILRDGDFIGHDDPMHSN
jgi:hypothetical protein